MSESNDELKKFIRSKSKFFNLSDGDEAEVQFLSAEAVTTHFQGKAVDCMRYRFLVDGQEMLWDRASRDFAEQISAFYEGDFIAIKRIGKRNQTKYTVRKLE